MPRLKDRIADWFLGETKTVVIEMEDGGTVTVTSLRSEDELLEIAREVEERVKSIRARVER